MKRIATSKDMLFEQKLAQEVHPDFQKGLDELFLSKPDYSKPVATDIGFDVDNFYDIGSVVTTKYYRTHANPERREEVKPFPKPATGEVIEHDGEFLVVDFTEPAYGRTLIRPEDVVDAQPRESKLAADGFSDSIVNEGVIPPHGWNRTTDAETLLNKPASEQYEEALEILQDLPNSAERDMAIEAITRALSELQRQSKSKLAQDGPELNPALAPGVEVGPGLREMPRAPKAPKQVTVVGPNLPAGSAEFEVHAKGCRDLGRRRGYDQFDMEASSRADVVKTVYYDQLDEAVDSGYYNSLDEAAASYEREFNFLPCTGL